MSSYNEKSQSFELDKGNYTIRIGESSRDTKISNILSLDHKIVTQKVSNSVKIKKIQQN